MSLGFLEDGEKQKDTKQRRERERVIFSDTTQAAYFLGWSHQRKILSNKWSNSNGQEPRVSNISHTCNIFIYSINLSFISIFNKISNLSVWVFECLWLREIGRGSGWEKMKRRILWLTWYRTEPTIQLIVSSTIKHLMFINSEKTLQTRLTMTD